MENNNNLKSLYSTLFVLGVIETVLTLFLGYFVAIAVFIVALIIKSKLPKDQPAPSGIKFMITASALHFFAFFINCIFTIIFFFSYGGNTANTTAGLSYLMMPFFYFLILLVVFVLLIIGCIKVYNESKELE